ncbi:MAG: hypothetical protein ACRERV_09630 [Methylococcales bacterium]
MPTLYVLTEYIDRAMIQAEYNNLYDYRFRRRIPISKGVIAFGGTLEQCQNDLHSTLDDWILVDLQLGHDLPVIGDINFNKELVRESMDTL